MPHNLARRGGYLAVVAAALLALAACGGSKSVAAPPAALGTVVNFGIPSNIAHIPLTKADGSSTDLAAYRGKQVMIADFLTECTDVCPMISANTAALGRALNADGLGNKVALLEISVDPQRDTAARLAAYQKLYGVAPADWTLLRATPANTKALWGYFNVAYGRTKEQKPASIDWLTHKPLTYDVYHLDDLIFLNGQGRQRFIVNDDPDTQTGGGVAPPKALVQFLDAKGIKALNRPNPVDSWTVDDGVQVFSWLLNQKLAAPA